MITARERLAQARALLEASKHSHNILEVYEKSLGLDEKAKETRKIANGIRAWLAYDDNEERDDD